MFIDEINSIIQFTHNETIKDLKRVYTLLLRIIKNAHKVILCNNIICDNVFELLEVRGDDEQKFIINEFSKFEGVQARRCKNENNFLEIIKNRIESKQYFLFGSDCCRDIENYFNILTKDLPRDYIEENFILITANNKMSIGDASETFKNKFVFYSPSIITGVDFSIDQAQDVFLYIKGQSIDAQASYQQATRCRNIKNLYYFCETKPQEAEYESLEQLRTLYTSYIKQSEEIKDVCEILDDDYNVVINEDKFFNLCTYNEYIKDIYRTNRAVHFENVLKTAKFSICSRKNETNELLNKELKKEMTEITKETKET